MNDHEAQRIAAAMHQARPDWPTASVLTLIRNKLIDRPRRDVFVALAWVASEPNSATPARVLEAGPWWKAAGIETPAGPNRIAQRPPWCANCGQGLEAPIHGEWPGKPECMFTERPATVDAERKAQLLAEAKAATTAALPPARKEAEPEPERCEHGDCIRAHSHTGPHQGPPTATPAHPAGHTAETTEASDE